jgi:hypothetical protein
MCCALRARSLTGAASGVILPARSLAGAAGAPMQRERAGRAAESEQTVLSSLQHCLVSWMSWQCGNRHSYRSCRADVGCPTVVPSY